MMEIQDSKAIAEKRLIDLACGIDFDRRYYGFVDAHQAPQEHSKALGREAIEAALTKLGLPFTYNRREKFLALRPADALYSLGLNLAWSRVRLEAILVFKPPVGHVGGPYQGLAYDCAKVRDPRFERQPRYPWLPFSNVESLQEVLEFAMTLFTEIRREIERQEWTLASQSPRCIASIQREA